jgi:Ser/Thr protein kinase RdoA (MazF antagonist)
MNDQAFTFQTLHPDTIMDALFEQGIRVDSGLTPLNSYENRVYQFQDEDRQRFVVKFYRPQRWSAEQIQEEHQFAHDLLDDDVPVAAPLKFNNQTLLTHEGFYYAVFPSLGGRQFEADNIDQMEWVARYLGRIHQTGRKEDFIARPTIGIQEYLLEPRQVFETSALIPKALKDNFLNATDKLIDAVKTGAMIFPFCVCTAIVTLVIFSGVMARCSSISMMHVWGQRFRTCGCCSMAIKLSNGCSLKRLLRPMKSLALLIQTKLS